MSFNVYDDRERAESYAKLEFPGTYYLAFRDLPAILSEHVKGTRAIDFGCGAGRSTRFLKGLGFAVTGIDISASMLEQARAQDPEGTYLVVEDARYEFLGVGAFDLVFTAFAFDNIPGVEDRMRILAALRALLGPRGRLVMLGSRPELYTHEWASFTTSAFPENKGASSGEAVRVVMKDVPDSRPVVDLIWFDEDYMRLFESAGLRFVAKYEPLGSADEPYDWVSETTVPPWMIYVVERGS